MGLPFGSEPLGRRGREPGIPYRDAGQTEEKGRGETSPGDGPFPCLFSKRSQAAPSEGRESGKAACGAQERWTR